MTFNLSPIYPENTSLCHGSKQEFNLSISNRLLAISSKGENPALNKLMKSEINKMIVEEYVYFMDAEKNAAESSG